MLYRRIVIQSLLQTFGGELSNIEFQKYLFLFTRLQERKSFDFVPYRFGCFSFQSCADKRAMTFYGQLVDSKNWKKKDNENYLSRLSATDCNALEEVKAKFGGMKRNDLLRHVYETYPYYSVNSELKEEIFGADHHEAVDVLFPDELKPMLFTIGYEGKNIDSFMNHLIHVGVRLLVDVRKNAVSMKYGFSKNQLRGILQKLKIQYVHISELGIESEKRRNLSSQSDYDRLFDDYERTVLKTRVDEINRIIQTVVGKGRVAITCFESSHARCHRGRLAAAISDMPAWKYQLVHL